MWSSPIEAVTAVLELAATEHPEILDFQLYVLRNGAMRFAVTDLAASLGVPVERLAPTITKACRDLKRLERRRGAWRDPGALVASPNVAALCGVCAARLGRVQEIGRRRRLEATLRRLRAAHEQDRSRAWIEDFIGRPARRQETER